MRPSPPSNISVIATTSRSIYVSWQPPHFTGYTNITSFVVKIVKNDNNKVKVSTHNHSRSSPSFAIQLSVDAKNFSLHVSTLKPFTWYDVTMRSANEIGWSGFGDVKRVQTLPEGMSYETESHKKYHIEIVFF